MVRGQGVFPRRALLAAGGGAILGAGGYLLLKDRWSLEESIKEREREYSLPNLSDAEARIAHVRAVAENYRARSRTALTVETLVRAVEFIEPEDFKRLGPPSGAAGVTRYNEGKIYVVTQHPQYDKSNWSLKDPNLSALTVLRFILTHEFGHLDLAPRDVDITLPSEDKSGDLHMFQIAGFRAYTKDSGGNIFAHFSILDEAVVQGITSYIMRELADQTSRGSFYFPYGEEVDQALPRLRYLVLAGVTPEKLIEYHRNSDLLGLAYYLAVQAKMVSNNKVADISFGLYILGAIERGDIGVLEQFRSMLP